VSTPDQNSKDELHKNERYILSEVTIPQGAFNGFYRGVLRNIIILALFVVAIVGYWRGLEAVYGVVLGSTVAAINFWWMQQSITALTNAYSDAMQRQENMELAASKPQVPLQPKAVKFFLRYLLIGSVAFVMMKDHRDAALGFFVGLGLPIAALLMEVCLQLIPFLNKSKTS
jgi:hypothetical protein